MTDACQCNIAGTATRHNTGSRSGGGVSVEARQCARIVSGNPDCRVEAHRLAVPAPIRPGFHRQAPLPVPVTTAGAQAVSYRLAVSLSEPADNSTWVLGLA